MAGRPTKYDPLYCDALIDHMRKGLSYEAFAGAIEVSKQTLYTWEKAHPEFVDAKGIGIELSRLWWEQQGQVGLFSEFQGSNINASIWVFNMKNRFQWRDKQPDEVTTVVQANENHPLTNEQLLFLVKGARGKA